MKIISTRRKLDWTRHSGNVNSCIQVDKSWVQICCYQSKNLIITSLEHFASTLNLFEHLQGFYLNSIFFCLSKMLFYLLCYGLSHDSFHWPFLSYFRVFRIIEMLITNLGIYRRCPSARSAVRKPNTCAGSCGTWPLNSSSLSNGRISLFIGSLQLLIFMQLSNSGQVTNNAHLNSEIESRIYWKCSYSLQNE